MQLTEEPGEFRREHSCGGVARSIGTEVPKTQRLMLHGTLDVLDKGGRSERQRNWRRIFRFAGGSSKLPSCFGSVERVFVLGGSTQIRPHLHHPHAGPSCRWNM